MPIPKEVEGGLGVCRDRWRVDGCGKAYSDSKIFHLVIARGSQPGQRHILEGEGDETPDTLPGDLVFVLQQKPHVCFRKSGVAHLGCQRIVSEHGRSRCCPLACASQPWLNLLLVILARRLSLFLTLSRLHVSSSMTETQQSNASQ